MQIETADVSLIGHREENQDRVAVAAADQAVLLGGDRRHGRPCGGRARRGNRALDPARGLLADARIRFSIRWAFCICRWAGRTKKS